MIEFKKTADSRSSYYSRDITDISFKLHSSDLSVTDLLEEFKYFLLACGYYIDGDIVVYKEEEDENKDD